MIRINLRDYYPFYTRDTFIYVPEAVALLLLEAEHEQEAHRIRTYRHKAYYSLDYGDDIERDALHVGLSPYDLYEQKLTEAQLHAAIAGLPDKQAKRIYAYFFLGMSKAAIARAEGVNEGNVRKSIARALRNMEAILKKSL